MPGKGKRARENNLLPSKIFEARKQAGRVSFLKSLGTQKIRMVLERSA